MACKLFPDHAGRMPDHPRYGNPSDPDEESERVQKAFQNVQDWQDWQDRNGGQFSGGVKTLPELQTRQSWFRRLFNLIKGAFR